LPEIIQSYEIKNIVVAIANVNSKVLTELNDICRLMNVQLTRVPSTSELISGKIYLKDLESLSEEDLIGRTQIYPDEKAIANFLRGKRILISGAGGSIGSEIARQVHRYSPSTVFMLDRDESLLHSLQLSLDGKGMLTSNNLILADIRDAQRIDEVFSETKPDVVFHAAALKHLSILEMYPQEAEKTNVAGTENIARAAISSGVSCLVNISTDKATPPVSVLGKSKKKSEEIVKAYGLTSSENPRFLSVRFGNVLGSRGSVLEAFKYQISKGGPVVVTDPEVKRYFMTIPEAVHLVLEAGAKGKNGEVLVLDMGVQISIQDIAKKMITRSGKNIEIVFSGLRAGEKIAESLVDDETLRPITPGSKVLRLQN
jgi:FlaA1/EpsC-like NDP-sugar epimerase